MNLEELLKLEASLNKLKSGSSLEPEIIRDCLNLMSYYLGRLRDISEELYNQADKYSETSLNDKSGLITDDELAALYEMFQVTETVRYLVRKTSNIKTEFPDPEVVKKVNEEGIPF